ncbi:hypothetical protein PIROE2DRAFT_14608 [Piromyces sp. E2]|nr:hypothetical protein PIROE2DRAFT_14608 [Piromyces sp. E2]|eukprot:OUM59773.1 hypothetical protein PIROE2DRAFT_14608 [Piromyces sp. E2]
MYFMWLQSIFFFIFINKKINQHYTDETFFISDAFHKTNIEFTEIGVKAAAMRR